MIWPVKQGFFGWKGFRPDPEKYTTYTVIITIINFFLLITAVDELFEIAPGGDLKMKRDPVEAIFYIKCGLVIISSVICAFLIKHKDPYARWGARIISCGLTFILALMLIINV